MDHTVPEPTGFERRIGDTSVSVLVGADGQVREVKIETGSGLPTFDHAILLAARAARFLPGTVGCKPVEQWTTMRFPGESADADVRPSYLNKREMERALALEYPPLLRDRGTGGTTIVWFYVDEQGMVRQAMVRRSSGHPELDRAALRVARIARFSPALDDGEPVAVWISLPISFRTLGSGRR